MRAPLILGMTFAVTGCAITQEVHPIEVPSWSEVCIIENPEVRNSFLTEYVSSLEGLAYQVRVLPPKTELTACPVTSTYTAQWSWDWFWTFGVYMSFAEINVYQEGKRVGDATYDARGGDANPKLVAAAAPKIRELVTTLFPRRP